MPILQVVLVLVIVGVVLWLINTYLPLQPPIKTIINVLVTIVLILWIIQMFFPGLDAIRIGH